MTRYQRGGHTKLNLNAGNLIELLGAAMGCTAVYLFFGLRGALVAGAVALLVLAEFVYDGHVWRVPLPYRPQPVVRTKKALTAALGRLRKLRRR